MAITTIQLHEDVKSELDRLKEGKQTYEEIILKMIRVIEQQKRKQRELLIEGCKEMAKDMLRINKEWESVDADIDWEWNENGG